METKTKSKKTSIIWLVATFVVCIALLVFCQFYFGDPAQATTFYPNTFVNGIDISGKTVAEAEDLLEEELANSKENMKITLKSHNKEWDLCGDDFLIVGNFEKELNDTFKNSHKRNLFRKKSGRNGLNIDLPYQNLICEDENCIDNIVSQVQSSPLSSRIKFSPDDKEMFCLSENQTCFLVDRTLLQERLKSAIKNKEDVVEIPLQEVLPDDSVNKYLEKISLRSSFSSDYSKSSIARKNNIKKALASFNGLIIEPGEEISFNQTTGERTTENGYKNANIILNGTYMPGVGGGVCQASSTLYNALLLAGVDVLEANHHSLPASYVPLSFDAMVSEGLSDLVFKNNLDTPIFIKAYGTDERAIVEVYGYPFDEGISIRLRSEIVKILPHSGDEIITDNEGKYADKVLYKGEYYRLKYPQEGYETKGYIQYIKDGKVVEEKEIRHDRYSPQKGVIVEGNSSLEEGMVLPENNVKYISPQKITTQTYENAKKRWKID